jgi:integrase/recombinase XerD
LILIKVGVENMQTLNIYLDGFANRLSELEKNEKTITLYLLAARQFLGSLTTNLSSVKTKHIKNFKQALEEYGYAQTTIHTKLVAVNVFIKYLNQFHEFKINAEIVYPPKQRCKNGRKTDEYLSNKDFNKLINAVEEKKDTRTLALFHLLYYTGMRISEALSLEIGDIGHQFIKIKGKGKQVRNVYISHPKLRESLENYVLERKQPYSKHTKALFVGERGPITRQTAHFLIKKYAKIAGITETKAHVHNLRHLFALNCLEKNIDIDDLAALLGHTDINYTRIYTEKTTDEYSEIVKRL